MKNKFWIVYDKTILYINIIWWILYLALVWTELTYAYTIVDNSGYYNVYSAIPTINLIFILTLTLSINRYKIENGKLKMFYSLRRFDLSKVTKVSYDKVLRLHYTSFTGREEKLVLFMMGLRNNREKYASFLTALIKEINKDSIKISDAPEEIIDAIHTNRTAQLKSKDGSPLKVGGWLLAWQTYMLITFFAFTAVGVYYLNQNSLLSIHEIKANIIPYFGIGIFFIAYAVINFICVALVHIKHRWTVRVFIALYYIKAFIMMQGFGYILYIWSPIIEPNIVQIIVFLLLGLADGIMPALLFRRYFTQSIRVKTTYIK